MNVFPCACDIQRYQRNLVVPNNSWYQFCSHDYLHTNELAEVTFHVVLSKWLKSHGDDWDFSLKESKSFDRRDSRSYQSVIRSGASHLIYFPSITTTACTGSVPVMTATSTSAALGDTSLLHVLGLVLFAQDRSCLQGHIHMHFSAQSTPAHLHYSPLTGLTPQMCSFSMLLTLFYSEVVGVMLGPLFRWSSGSLNLCHPCPRPVPCQLNPLHLLKFNETQAFTSEDSPTRLAYQPYKQTMIFWSGALFWVQQRELWYSTHTFLVAYPVFWSLLWIVGSEVANLTLKGRISSNRAVDTISAHSLIKLICPIEPCKAVFTFY